MKRTDATSLRAFDTLPDSAFVRLPVVAALFGVSTATIWRWTRASRLPATTRIAGVTLWNVGDIRRCMAGMRIDETGAGVGVDEEERASST